MHLLGAPIWLLLPVSVVRLRRTGAKYRIESERWTAQTKATATRRSYGPEGERNDETPRGGGGGWDEPAPRQDDLQAHLMEVETTGFDAAAATSRTSVGAQGGYFEQAARNAQAAATAPGLNSPGTAGPVRGLLDQVGRALPCSYKEEGSENVSEAYYDTESRPGDPADCWKAAPESDEPRQRDHGGHHHHPESAISGHRGWEIRQLTGTLGHYDALVDFAAVYMTLQECPRAVQRDGGTATRGSATGLAARFLLLAGAFCNSPETWQWPRPTAGCGSAPGGDRRGRTVYFWKRHLGGPATWEPEKKP